MSIAEYRLKVEVAEANRKLNELAGDIATRDRRERELEAEVERSRELLWRWLSLLGPELSPGSVRLRDETRLILADALSSGSKEEGSGG